MFYNKPPLTYAQQVDLMISRGISVVDHTTAMNCLAQINYYRLSAYFLPFQKVKDVFNPGTTFDTIISAYLFDRDLRLLVFDEIERIEVAIRTQIIYQLSHKYGAHWQDNVSLFINPHTNKKGDIVNIFQEVQSIIRGQKTAKHPEVFYEALQHYLFCAA